MGLWKWKAKLLKNLLIFQRSTILLCTNATQHNTPYRELSLINYVLRKSHVHLKRRHLSSSPSLISTNKYDVCRGQYAKVQDSDVYYFEQLLGKHKVVTDQSEIEPYNSDWMKAYHGNSGLLLRPGTTEEVSAILRYCNEKTLAVCPQGGNTGLVGGSVPVFDEIILSLALMNQLIDVDITSGVVTCQAGCILEMIDNKISEHRLMVPLDLGARGSCHIGGNVSTNAGGLRLMRYGSLHGNVLGLEVVLANGKVVDCMSSLRKDNTGYDMKQLFIGAEGTLGIVTKVAILCIPKPTSVNVAFVGCESFEQLLQTFSLAKRMLNEILSAFELIDQESLNVTKLHFKVQSPIEPITKYPFYGLLETMGSNEKHDEEKMMAFLEQALNSGLVKDGCVYTEPSRIQTLWSIRERITAATLKDGYVYKYDVSLPLPNLYDLVLDLRQRLDSKVTRCNGFGHVGDGNIHVNVSCPTYNEDIHVLLEPYVFEWVSRHKGSISAEHGLGLQKRKYIHYCKSKEAIESMKLVKDLFDPKNILNPYKVLPLR